MSADAQRILVIDDNPDVAQIVRLAVRKLDRKVEVVGEVNADRAIARLKYEQYDLIISDYKMREMNGLDLLAQARPAEKDEVRLLFTGYSAKLEPAALKQAHLDGVLEKPLILEALRAVIDAVLDHDEATMAALRRALDARVFPYRTVSAFRQAEKNDES